MGAARGIAEDGEIGGGDLDRDRREDGARSRTRSSGRRMTITGTHGYRAPEVYDRDYGKAADWWNVGILIIEMLTAENPLRGENRRESEYLTKHKDLQLLGVRQGVGPVDPLAFLNRDPTKRLRLGRAPRAEQGDESGPRAAAKIKGRLGGSWRGNGGAYGEGGARLAAPPRLAHAYFAKIDPPPSLAREMKPRVQARVRGEPEDRPALGGDGPADARLLLPDGRLPEGVDGDAADVAAEARGPGFLRQLRLRVDAGLRGAPRPRRGADGRAAPELARPALRSRARRR